MRYILTRKNLKPSARELKKALGPGWKISTEIINNTAPTIRWGNSDIGNYPEETETKFNYPEVIRFCSNKKLFSDIMQEIGVECVVLHQGIPERFPVVVRQKLEASRGEGIVVCRNLDEFNRTPKNRFWTNWYRFRYELGVHILGGEVVKVFKKLWAGEGNESEYPIKNMEKGYHFSIVNPEKYARLHPFIEDFYEKFRMEFGRLDVGFDEDSRTYRIIEANSAPGISENDNTKQLYTSFLLERI